MINFISIYLNVCLAFAAVVASDWGRMARTRRVTASLPRRTCREVVSRGENLAWRAPYGGRSAPIVMGDRVYLQNTAGMGETEQERIMCFNADTGKLLWNIASMFTSATCRRIALDGLRRSAIPTTGNVFVFGVGGNLIGLNRDGKVLWERSLAEDFGLLTTHGGRTVSPIIDGDLVIVSGVTFSGASTDAARIASWRSTRRPARRLGERSRRPSLRHDLRAANHRERQRHALLIQGAATVSFTRSNRKRRTVWKIEISKRGLNTGVVVKEHRDSHAQRREPRFERDGNDVAVDATAKGEIKKEQIKWRLTAGRAASLRRCSMATVCTRSTTAPTSPRSTSTPESNSGCKTSARFRKRRRVRDGKLYVGTENGKFFILKPSRPAARFSMRITRHRSEPEAIIGRPRVERTRLLRQRLGLYCIGKKAQQLIAAHDCVGDGNP
jgi:hypothetical protein